MRFVGTGVLDCPCSEVFRIRRKPVRKRRLYRRVDVGIDPYEVERKCPISIVGIDPYEVERNVQFLLWDDAHNVPIWRANADCTAGLSGRPVPTAV